MGLLKEEILSLFPLGSETGEVDLDATPMSAGQEVVPPLLLAGQLLDQLLRWLHVECQRAAEVHQEQKPAEHPVVVPRLGRLLGLHALPAC